MFIDVVVCQQPKLTVSLVQCVGWLDGWGVKGRITYGTGARGILRLSSLLSLGMETCQLSSRLLPFNHKSSHVCIAALVRFESSKIINVVLGA